jgi:hypothetical protein
MFPYTLMPALLAGMVEWGVTGSGKFLLWLVWSLNRCAGNILLVSTMPETGEKGSQLILTVLYIHNALAHTHHMYMRNFTAYCRWEK